MVTTSLTLLERLQNEQDIEAWQHFVDLYTPLVYRWVCRTGIPSHSTADLVQDIFVILLRSLPRFEYDPARSFGAWLRTTTLNRCRDHLRRRQHLTVTMSSETEPTAPDDLDGLFEEEYHTYLARRALDLMQTHFEFATWKACWETVVEGRRARDVAQELGISENAVYIARGRVLRRLRDELDDLWE